MQRISSLAKKPFVVMPAVAILVFGAWFAIQGRGGSSAASTLPTDTVVPVTVGALAKTVSAQGTVAAVDSDDMSFSSAGTVTAVNVTAGQSVNAGDVLATMDSPTLRQAVADAESKLADAKATLSDDEAASASSSRVAADQSNVTSAQDALDQANENLAGTSLVAPYAAKITTVGVTVGDQLGSNGADGTTPTGSGSGTGRTTANLGSGTGNGSTTKAAVSLISLNAYKVSLGFDSTDIGSIASGQVAKVTLSTASASTTGRGRFGGFAALFGGGGGATANATTATTTPASTASDAATTSGAVSSVSSVADASSGVASYPVVVTFNDSTGSFNVGATVQVDITVSSIDNVIQVPTLAVQTNGTTSTVTVRSASGKDSTRTVTTGITSGTMTQVTSGLTASDQVVITFPRFGGVTRTGTGTGGRNRTGTGTGTGGFNFGGGNGAGG